MLEAQITSAYPDSSVFLFPLPEMLPQNVRLLLHVETNTALLLRIEEGEVTSCHGLFHLPPSATRIFLCLLQAYPEACSYHALFLTLYPLSQKHHTEQVWEREHDLALRPIRRALASLSPVLRCFSLHVASLRGWGYVLEATVATKNRA